MSHPFRCQCEECRNLSEALICPKPEALEDPRHAMWKASQPEAPKRELPLAAQDWSRNVEREDEAASPCYCTHAGECEICAKPQAPTERCADHGAMPGHCQFGCDKPAKAQAPGALPRCPKYVAHPQAVWFEEHWRPSYEALEARNKTLEELVKQDYDSTARDAQVIEALERELAEAKNWIESEKRSVKEWNEHTQMLAQARAELVELRKLHAIHSAEEAKSAALVEALKHYENVCAFSVRGVGIFVAREALKKYGGGE